MSVGEPVLKNDRHFLGKGFGLAILTYKYISDESNSVIPNSMDITFG